MRGERLVGPENGRKGPPEEPFGAIAKAQGIIDKVIPRNARENYRSCAIHFTVQLCVSSRNTIVLYGPHQGRGIEKELEAAKWHLSSVSGLDFLTSNVAN